MVYVLQSQEFIYATTKGRTANASNNRPKASGVENDPGIVEMFEDFAKDRDIGSL